MENVSVIRKHAHVVHNTSLRKIYDLIRDPNSCHRQQIEEIRQLHALGSPEASKLKVTLDGFTVSGIFKKRREKKNLIAYSGMLILDVDHLLPNEVQQVVERAKLLPNTYMVFLSLAG